MPSTIQVRVDDELKRKSEKLEKSRVSASKDNYRSADAVIADMREKYGR